MQKDTKKCSQSNADSEERLIIYQVFPRILTNTEPNPVPWGSLERNGSGKFNDYTSHVLRSIRELGVNCLWFTGVIENATKSDYTAYGIECDNPNVVKGEAGSPYAIKDYYDVNPCLAEDIPARMKEFEALIRRVHAEGMKLLLDFVPNHTARVYHSDCAPAGVRDFGDGDNTTYFFERDNNYYYMPSQRFAPDFPLDTEGHNPYVEFPAKATGNDCFTAFCGRNDWYETVKLNYGRDYWNGSEHFDPVPDTWLKMLSILRYWASKGVDGFRCDMVFMVPLPFWHWAIPQVKADYPGCLFIGEIYDIGLYRPFLEYGCFDYLYDKVNLYDTLVGIERHHVSAARLTSCWQTVDGIGEQMLNFLENHDEVRFGSKAYAGTPARVVPSLVVSSMMTKGPFMIYYGQELGESANDNEGFAGDNARSTIFDYWSYDTMRRWYDGGLCSDAKLTVHERWLRNMYKRVLTLCNSSAPLRTGAFFDLMYVNLDNPRFDPHSQYAFIRYTTDEAVLIVANFDHRDVTLSLNIPDLAFDMACLPEGDLQVTDLLWGSKRPLNLRRGGQSTVSVGASNAVVLLIESRKETEKNIRCNKKASQTKEIKK